MEQHNLTHFPSQPWCKMCVESRGRDSPHREQSKIDAVVLQLQFDHGYMGDGGPLQIARFLVGADTFSGAIHATMVPDSKPQPNGCVTWFMNAFVYVETKKLFDNCCWTKWHKNVVLKDKTCRFCDKCHRHRAIRAMEQWRKPSPQYVDLPEHIWQ